MKKIYTLLALISFTGLNAQSPSLQAWTLDVSGTTTLIALNNGTTVSYVTTASTPTSTSTHTTKVKFKNISAVSHTYSVIRTDIVVNPASPGAIPYFCFGDLGTCYSTWVNEPNPGDYSPLGPGAETINGKHLIVDLDEAYTVGYSAINYKLFDLTLGKNGYDTLSFTFKYNQFSGINEHDNSIGNISNVYPNPSSGNVSISVVLTEENNVKVQVYNTLGTLVYNGNEQHMSGQNNLSIDCNHLNSGLYFVTVTAGNSKVTKRLVINK